MNVEGFRSEFMDTLVATLQANPDSTKTQLSVLLTAAGWEDASASTINKALYKLETAGRVEWRTAGKQTRHWSARQNQTRRRNATPPPQGTRTDANRQPLQSKVELRAWQREALNVWNNNGRIGVVQAVTGAGKTQLGIEATRQQLADTGRALVVVPTRALLHQWKRSLDAQLGDGLTGLRGDGYSDSLATHRVLISTPHSAIDGVDFSGRNGLLIADECHRYGAETWSQVLDPTFTSRLGLTATYERQDDGLERHLSEYFGAQPVFDIGYIRAIREKAIAPFRLAFVGVSMTADEQDVYRRIDQACKRARGTLIRYHRLPEEPFGEFLRDVQRLAADSDHPASGEARRYLMNFAKRRAMLADTRTKLTRLQALEPAVALAHGTLIFTQTKSAARNAARMYAEFGHPAAAISGDLDSYERERLLEAFRDGDKTVLTAPRVLDEGIDVPDADLGIVISASSSKRQMIQRLGRVLRIKAGGAPCSFVILYVSGTSEDPQLDAHAGFIELAWKASDAYEIFPPNTSAEQICHFLRTGNRPVAAERRLAPVVQHSTACTPVDPALRDVHEWTAQFGCSTATLQDILRTILHSERQRRQSDGVQSEVLTVLDRISSGRRIAPSDRLVAQITESVKQMRHSGS